MRKTKDGREANGIGKTVEPVENKMVELPAPPNQIFIKSIPPNIGRHALEAVSAVSGVHADLLNPSCYPVPPVTARLRVLGNERAVSEKGLSSRRIRSIQGRHGCPRGTERY